MTKRRKTKSSTAAKPVRRSRGEIDRNYFFGDVLIKTGVAVAVALAVIAFYTPFSLQDAIREKMTQYLWIVGMFAGLGVVCFFTGRHLRKTATHWDFD
jgi:FtsH-binding integral membrane protein